jgi:hypothetical protein
VKHFFSVRRTLTTTVAATLVAGLLAAPAGAAETRSRARSVQGSDGARAAHSGLGARGDNGAFGGQRGLSGDGEGNVSAGARGGFTTESGAQGRRRASFEREDDGSIEASREGSFEGDSRSGEHSRSYSRDADGNASAERSTTLANEETGNSFEGSTTYTQGEGFSRSASCTDSSGDSVSCSPR